MQNKTDVDKARRGKFTALYLCHELQRKPDRELARGRYM
jgi:hypothetical protein